ncbi:CopG family transcriptional regulator [Anaerofustis stercorihominis]|uniref:CopG family transcriptional regulator n=2 Tax=Anaerofustis stercorihominis TaxID=214853 RepID=A0A3E3DZ81_9FIRM|nr:CopG family transcriptional regulator [Anaerofustis stercorihominis]
MEVYHMAHKKLGRPTDNPKRVQVTVRLDEGSLKILDKYCEESGLSRAEAIRVGIGKLKK